MKVGGEKEGLPGLFLPNKEQEPQKLLKTDPKTSTASMCSGLKVNMAGGYDTRPLQISCY